MRLVLVATVLLLLAVPAHAGTGRVGLCTGGGQFGDRTMSWMGLHLAAEQRYEHLGVGIELGYHTMSDQDADQPWLGKLTRAAALAHLHAIGTRESFQLALWLDLGAGVEHVAWQRGGVLVRPQLIAGLSATMGPDIGGVHFGDYIQAHLLVGEGADAPGRRLGFQISVGLYFGR